MFTGIIEELGTIKKVKKDKGNIHLTIDASFTPELKIDQSIAHNGVCLTVISIKNNEYNVIAIKETLEKTNLGNLIPGDKINLERCMKIGDRLDGHIVQGHVDTRGTILKNEHSNDDWLLEIKIDKKWMKYCILKGSIAIDGISLTIAKINDNYNDSYGSITMSIIPHTLKNTNLQFKNKKDTVNVETDFFAKYIEKLLPKKD